MVMPGIMPGIKGSRVDAVLSFENKSFGSADKAKKTKEDRMIQVVKGFRDS